MSKSLNAATEISDWTVLVFAVLAMLGLYQSVQSAKWIYDCAINRMTMDVESRLSTPGAAWAHGSMYLSCAPGVSPGAPETCTYRREVAK